MTIGAAAAQNIDVLGGGSAQTPFRVFTIDPGTTVVIGNLGISNGFLSSGNGAGIDNYGNLTLAKDSVTENTDDAPNGNGGGICNNKGGELYLSSTGVTSNTTDQTTGNGGGIYNMGQLTLDFGCTIGGNETSDGGGVCNAQNAEAHIWGNSVIEYNFANFGGGIDNSGTLTMTGGEIYSNYNSGNGGGIYVAGGVLTLAAGVTVSYNEARGGDGGGMYVASGVVKVSGGSFATNTAESGGGIYTGGGSLTLTGSLTITGNKAVDEGGGLYLGQNSTTTFNGVTITGNEAPAGVGYYQQFGATINLVKLNNPDGFAQGN